MKQQFLDLTGLTELVAYIESNVTDKKEILPYASNKLFPSTGDVNAIYIDTATNTIYRWDTSSKTYIILAKAVKSVSISESTENGKITLTVDGVKTTVPIHGLGSAAYTNSNAYSPADHTHTKAQIGLGSVDNTADKDKSVKHANTADSATTAGTATTATNVSAEIGQADIARHVWFSDNYTETKRNYNDNFKYNPTTNTVTANISGSAASANSVLWSGITNKPSTFTPSAHNHDDSTITSLNASKLFGTIDIARLPQGALERLVIVADDTARFKLTTANVQLGDTIKVTKTEKMYYVVDESKLSSEAGYSVYTAGTATSVPWSGVTGKPSSYPPASHNHDERYYTETEINSKLAEKAEKVHTHVKSEVGLGNVDNTADANKSVKYATSAGSATSASNVKDSNNGTATTFSYSKAGLNYGDYTWLAAWNGNEMRAVHKSQFATSGHTHNYITATMSSSAVPAKAADGRVEFYYNVNQGLANNMPASNNANAIISLNRHGGDYPSQLGFSSDGNIYYREGVGTTAWKTIFTSSNYTSYTVTKSGSGASGTWGINITGSSASCSGNATTATTASNLSGFINTTSSGTAVNSATSNGHYYVTETSGIYNISDGAAFVQAYSSSWVAQIYQDYRTGQIALRGKNNGTWQSWRKVLDSSNYTSYAATKGHSHGNYMGAISANGYYGMAKPDGSASDWIRTTSSGIIPYQSGSRGSGHSALGTSSWYFSSSYIDHMYSTDVKIADKVLLQYDSTNACLNFVFS